MNDSTRTKSNPLGENYTLKSGDEVGDNICCYNCGEPFINAIGPKSPIAHNDPIICQKCHGRMAIIISIN